MGRSQLQGTPWHYEYNKGSGVNNSKNCAFNTGNRCACKISPNHNSQCVGKLNCDEFERGSGRVSTVKCNTQKQWPMPNNHPMKTQSSISNKNKKKALSVEIGSSITIKSQVTDEIIELGKITSKDNPFYLKKINSIITVKGIPYKIVKIL